MLLGLSIRDVVLIDRLDLAFYPGLCVLTGETGAGKSILLDSLGLALGIRAESGLVRHGAAQASVSAEFELPATHPARRLLEEAGLAPADTLALRRVVNTDGRSRAFIDDQPVSIGLLRQLGEMLVEIQGQFAQHGLLNPATHRATLDGYGVAHSLRDTLAASWTNWRDARQTCEAAAAAFARARADEDFLRHAKAELDALDPQPGEEASLAEERALLMNRERLAEALAAAITELDGESGGEHALSVAARSLERLRDKAGGRLDAAMGALERAIAETHDAVQELERAAHALGHGEKGLEEIEERLFTLRALARKHNVVVDELAALRVEITRKLAAIDDGGDSMVRLKQQEEEARRAYLTAAEMVTKARAVAARKLDVAAAKELPPLRLEKAQFHTVLTPLDETEWNEHGRERIHFEVATNAGTPPGPLARIASGGELARFMLALNVVLAQTSPVATLVFDEVDSGVGGATAAAVGDRLHRLGRERQVLVVTHSPQVAARAAHHWRVAKSEGRGQTLARVEELNGTERREEIARMLSGSSVTAEARAAAESLMTGSNA